MFNFNYTVMLVICSEDYSHVLVLQYTDVTLLLMSGAHADTSAKLWYQPLGVCFMHESYL